MCCSLNLFRWPVENPAYSQNYTVELKATVFVQQSFVEVPKTTIRKANLCVPPGKATRRAPCLHPSSKKLGFSPPELLLNLHHPRSLQVR